MAVSTNLPGVLENIESFSTTLEVTGLDPSSLDGGTGDVSIGRNFVPNSRPQLMRNQRFTFSDSDIGDFICRVSEVQWDSMGVNVSAETMLNRLNVTLPVPPRSAALNTGMSAVLSAVGMSATGLPATTMLFPGWNGPLLEYIKHFCQVHKYEFLPSPTNPDVVIFRAARGTTVDPQFTNESFTVNDQLIAQFVNVVLYDYGSSSFGTREFTPFAVDDMQILTVDPGATAEYEVRVNGWLATVNQPVPMDIVGPGERNDAGAYCVAGSDGLPVLRDQWVAQGGAVRVAISPSNPSILNVTVTAPSAQSLTGPDDRDHFGPYSIAATALDNTLYNSLHITGTGLRYTRSEQRFTTATPPSVSRDEDGTLIDNPWVSNRARQWDMGIRAAQAYAGPTYTFTHGTTKRDLRGLVGARLLGPDVMFRVESVTGDPSGVSLTGAMDTTFNDFNTAWSGKTFSNFASVNTGLTFDSWATVPLRNQ